MQKAESGLREFNGKAPDWAHALARALLKREEVHEVHWLDQCQQVDVLMDAPEGLAMGAHVELVREVLDERDYTNLSARTEADGPHGLHVTGRPRVEVYEDGA